MPKAKALVNLRYKGKLYPAGEALEVDSFEGLEGLVDVGSVELSDNVGPTDLEDMKVSELKDFLAAEGVEYDPKAKKEDLIELAQGL